MRVPQRYLLKDIALPPVVERVVVLPLLFLLEDALLLLRHQSRSLYVVSRLHLAHAERPLPLLPVLLRDSFLFLLQRLNRYRRGSLEVPLVRSALLLLLDLLDLLLLDAHLLRGSCDWRLPGFLLEVELAVVDLPDR